VQRAPIWQDNILDHIAIPSVHSCRAVFSGLCVPTTCSKFSLFDQSLPSQNPHRPPLMRTRGLLDHAILAPKFSQTNEISESLSRTAVCASVQGHTCMLDIRLHSVATHCFCEDSCLIRRQLFYGHQCQLAREAATLQERQHGVLSCRHITRVPPGLRVHRGDLSCIRDFRVDEDASAISCIHLCCLLRGYCLSFRIRPSRMRSEAKALRVLACITSLLSAMRMRLPFTCVQLGLCGRDLQQQLTRR
jgi:hypothetical protein